MVIIKDLTLEDDTWEDGTILDPKSGKVYDCYIGFQDSNTLKVRGFLGFFLFWGVLKYGNENRLKKNRPVVETRRFINLN